MLICKKCNIEYEKESKFCSECGRPLFPKEEISFCDEEFGEGGVKAEEEKPKEKYICPGCKIIFEKMTSCIRCGAEVVPLASFQEKEEPEIEQEAGAGKESSQAKTIPGQPKEGSPQKFVCPICKKIYPHGKSCIKCGALLVPQSFSPGGEKPSHIPETKKPAHKTVYPSEIEEEVSEVHPHEKKPSKKIPDEEARKSGAIRRSKRDYRRLFFNMGGMVIMAIAGGYIFWSIYSYLPARNVAPQTPPPEEVPARVTPSPAMTQPEATASVSTPSIQAGAIEKIKEILETIRQANLHKDIHLFMSCYSKDFKDREGKRKSTLESWENFNYLDLSYEIKRHSPAGHAAKVRVDWLIKFSPKTGGPTQENRTALEVTFQKEGESWKIIEILSAS